MLNLNGKDLPNFVTVNNIEFSILPPIENNFLEVRGKSGVYLSSQEVGIRVFNIDITVIAEEINGVMSASRELAEWLHHKEPVKLIIADEPDKYYLVVPDGETTITEIVNVGQGTISFVCIEPYAYGEEKSETFTLTDSNNMATTVVTGTTETHPTIDIQVKENITSLSVISGDNAVIVGEPADITTTPVNPQPIILNDPMRSLEGWVQLDGGVTGEIDVVDGGVISGKYTHHTESFFVDSNGYGTSDRWHGPSAVKTLSKPLQDFSVNFRIDARPKNDKQVGRIELYLIDEQGNQFGKVAYRDSVRSTSKKGFEARAGTRGEGMYFLNNSMFNNNRFYGRFLITREGRNWSVSLADTREDGTFVNEIYRSSWFDSEGVWDKHKLAKVQIHTGVYGKHEPIDKLYISHIQVKELIDIDNSTETPIIAIPNDIITVDNNKMQVLLNGEPRFDLINPASTFMKFKKGINSVAVNPSNVDMRVTYTERWL